MDAKAIKQVPIFGDPRWIAAAVAPGYSKGKGGRKTGQPWAELRGPGPAGKTCKSCAFLINNGHGLRAYYKCGKVPVTHGPGTDIRLKDPACFLYSESKP